MKIGIDVSMIDRYKVGIGYYAFELLKAIVKIDKTNQYFLYTNNKDNLADIALPGNFRIVELKKNSANTFWIVRVVIDLYFRRVNYLISPSNFLFGVLFPNTVQIVHDTAPIKFPEFFNKDSSKKYGYWLKRCSKSVKYFATNSQTTRDDLLEFIGNNHARKTFVIGAGLNEWTQKAKSRAEEKRVKDKYNLPDNFVLSLSTIEPRKNHINMIRGFNEFIKKTNSNLKYVIAGKKGWLYEQIFEEVKVLKLEDKIQFIGYVDELDVPYLIDQSKVFLFVSTWEGIGLPPLEAYSRGVPVVTSDIKVMHECMQDKAIYANPEDPEEIGVKIAQAINSHNIHIDNSFVGRYDWKEVAKILLTKFN